MSIPSNVCFEGSVIRSYASGRHPLSLEAVWSLSRRWVILACLFSLFLVGCGSSGPDRPAVTQSQSEVAQAMEGVSAEQVMMIIPGSKFTHLHVNARLQILTAPNDLGQCTAAIGINGSANLMVKQNTRDLWYGVIVSPDWHLTSSGFDNIQ